MQVLREDLRRFTQTNLRLGVLGLAMIGPEHGEISDLSIYEFVVSLRCFLSSILWILVSAFLCPVRTLYQSYRGLFSSVLSR